MKVVNLSRRPFVNRRPIVRLGIVLWILGGLLVLANMVLFQAYWSGSRGVRAELEAVEAKAAAELKALSVLDRQVDRVDLAEQNSQAAYLNSLIAYRTFPWSSLFDDLERVLPRDVRLEAVSPAVHLAATERAVQAQKAALQERADTRRGRSSRRSRSETSAAAQSAEQELAADEVQLQLQGTAKNENALIELVDTLYRDEAFRQPVLSGERFAAVGGALTSSFEISVIYITRGRGEDAAVAEEAPSEDIATASEEPAEDAIASESAEKKIPAPTNLGAVVSNRPPPSRNEVAPAKPPAPPVVASEVKSVEPEARRGQERSGLRQDRTGVTNPSGDDEPSASESAAAERQRRIEELRQRRREALRRNRSGATGGRPPSGDFLGTAGDDTGRREGSTTPQRGGTERPSQTGRETPRGSSDDRRNGDGAPASATPRVQGSLIPGLPELLEGLLASPPSPLAVWSEEMG